MVKSLKDYRKKLKEKKALKKAQSQSDLTADENVTNDTDGLPEVVDAEPVDAVPVGLEEDGTGTSESVPEGAAAACNPNENVLSGNVPEEPPVETPPVDPFPEPAGVVGNAVVANGIENGAEKVCAASEETGEWVTGSEMNMMNGALPNALPDALPDALPNVDGAVENLNDKVASVDDELETIKDSEIPDPGALKPGISMFSLLAILKAKFGHSHNVDPLATVAGVDPLATVGGVDSTANMAGVNPLATVGRVPSVVPGSISSVSNPSLSKLGRTESMCSQISVKSLLEVERDILNIEKERLIIEKERLSVEKRRLVLEETRFARETPVTKL